MPKGKIRGNEYKLKYRKFNLNRKNSYTVKVAIPWNISQTSYEVYIIQCNQKLPERDTDNLF